MKRVFLFLASSLLLTGVVTAMSPKQHFAKGTVASIDRQQIVLLAAADDVATTAFVIKEGRTRFREDGNKSSSEHLRPGQSVRIYFRKEGGVWIATEVSWKRASVERSRT